MPRPFSFGNGLLRSAVLVAVSLGFVGPLNARGGTTSSPQHIKNSPLTILSDAVTSVSGALEFSVPDDTEFAVEDQDPIETFRVRTDGGPLRLDRIRIGARIRSQLTNNTIPTVSSPLLE